MNATLGVKKLDAEFLDSIYAIPNGEKIRQCLHLLRHGRRCAFAFRRERRTT